MTPRELVGQIIHAHGMAEKWGWQHLAERMAGRADNAYECLRLQRWWLAQADRWRELLAQAERGQEVMA